MSTDIVEHVARAIHDEFHRDPDPRRGAKTGFYFPGSPFAGLARAAIRATLEALRELEYERTPLVLTTKDIDRLIQEIDGK